MKRTFIEKISDDLRKSLIDWRVMVAFIPIAFLSYLFHEFGHWSLGEITGNKMTISLNSVRPQTGHFIAKSHELWSAIGGPLFTIIQALFFLIITRKTKSNIAYSFVFFAVFSRFFSIFLGGFDRQDEAGIAFLLGINKYLIAVLVLTILSLILWRSHRIMRLNLKALGYYTVLGVLSILMVINVDEFLIAK